MTQKEFIEVLKEKDYSYEIEGDKIIVTSKGNVHLYALTSLPPGVEFKNKGDVHLRALTSIPPGVEFRNKWDVHLNSIIGGWFQDWKGNIEGIGSNRLLNLMISKEMFI